MRDKLGKKYNFSSIEKKWQKIWKEKGIYEPDLNKSKKPFYNLMMFPYPSAEGLHVGNMYAFTGADIYGRYKRMRGFDVFEPIGLDGFGIHSENYAIKVGTHPAKQAKISEKRFYKQLEIIGNGFAWREHLETYDPEYYKWTQWIFIQLFKNGLAYRKKQAVNWCPSCKTVLADEQVLPAGRQGIAGKCERCGTVVEKRELEQWFFRITKYAKELLEDIENLDWSEKVKIAQTNWIGKSEGAILKFPIFSPKSEKISVEVFTTRPDTLFGATYLVLSPEIKILDSLKDSISNWKEVEKYAKSAAAKSEAERIEEGREKTGIELKGIKAINPATKEKIPVFIADYVLSSYGTGAIMAVPAHDQRDYEFAKKFNLNIEPVIIPIPTSLPTDYIDYTKKESVDYWKNRIKLNGPIELDGLIFNSGKYSGLTTKDGAKKIVEFVGGEFKTQYRLRDWLISRQRYWGPPIPMIFCQKCARLPDGQGWNPVPEKDLPVKLPFVKDFRPKGKGQSPLASVKSFYETKCPICGGKGRRETDVSDTFLDSAWYYLRYPSVGEKKIAWNEKITKKWLPVDMYTGGAEHSVLHLLYVRFIAKAFRDIGFLDFGEPAKKFRAHGLLIKDGAKMSKSKGNVINPDEYVKKFGADALRTYLMFLAPFGQGGDFRDQGILGITRFLDRVWKFGQLVGNNKISKSDSETEKLLHKTIKKIGEDIENLSYNTAISALMILLNQFESGKVNVEDFKVFIKLLAPFSPYIAEELWQDLNKAKTFESVHKESWPQYSEKLIEEKLSQIVVQINGKTRGVLSAKKGIVKEDLIEMIKKDEKLFGYIQGNIEKVIFVPDRIINIII